MSQACESSGGRHTVLPLCSVCGSLCLQLKVAASEPPLTMSHLLTGAPEQGRMSLGEGEMLTRAAGRGEG